MRRVEPPTDAPLGRAALLALLAAAGLCLGWTLFLKPDPDVAEGNRLIQKGKAKKALESYEKAEKRLGRRPKLDYNRGLAWFGLGKYDKAQEAFLTAGGSDDSGLRRKSFFNLANTLYKQAEPTQAAAAKGLGAVKALEKQLHDLGAQADTKARCQVMQRLMQGLKTAGASQEAMHKAFRKAFDEYRRVLKESPAYFDAKWNLELSLRHMTAARGAQKRLTDRGTRLAEQYKKECKPKDDKNKKKQDQNKKKQDQNKKKQDQNKQKQDQNKKKQDQNKQKQDQNKQKQDQNKQKQDQNKQKQNNQPRKQKPLTKEDIARKKAARELDKLERRQRERDRRRSRQGTTRQPLKDW